MAISTIPAPLQGKVAVVTGGSRGIGAGIATDLVRNGVTKIAITYTSNPALADDVLRVLRNLNPDVSAIAIESDLFSPTFATDLVDATLKGLSTERIDILVNNAAFANADAVAPILAPTKPLFDRIFTANTWSPFSLFLTALPHMPRGGRAIFLSSLASRIAPEPVSLYGASKAAQESLVRSIASTLSAEHGITANSVSVGPTDTDAVRVPIAAGVLPQEAIDGMVNMATAAKRIADVEDVANIVTFLASDAARWINGNSIPANGGALLALQG